VAYDRGPCDDGDEDEDEKGEDIMQ